MTDPVKKTITVPLRPEQAFSLFTDDLAKWWPVDSHSVSAAKGDLPRDVKVDRHAGGHITETKADGEPARWGTITNWEPGKSLGISWYVGRDEAEATDIMVVFTPVDTGTRVDLTHDGFDRLGDAATAMRDQYDPGWTMVLGGCFAGYCAKHITA